MLLKFHEKHGRNPQGSTSKQDVADLLEMKDKVLESLDVTKDLVCEDFARLACTVCALA